MNGTQHAVLVPKRYSTLFERLQLYEPQLFVGPVPEIIFEQLKPAGFLDDFDRDELLMVTFTDPTKAYLLSEVAACYWKRDAAPTPFDRWLDAAIAKDTKPTPVEPSTNR